MVFDNKNFTHLHVHSHYSTLDGSTSLDKLCSRAVELGMSAIALTDHGNLFGMLDFQNQAQTAGIKPIFGCEFYVAPKGIGDRTSKERNHIITLAYNQEGYKNLCRLSSISFIEGFYYKPRIDKEILAENSEGLIISSACMLGEVSRKILNGDNDGAKRAAGEYIDIAGKENFFLEIMDHGIPEQRIINKGLIALSREMNIPLIATNDAHFLNRDDYEASQILSCIGTGAKINDPDRFKLSSDQFYLKSPQEMMEVFSEVPEAIANTMEIASRCNVIIETIKTAPPEEKYKIPVFDVPEGKSEVEYLRELCDEGIKKRYSEITDEIKKRVDMELDVITKMGFCGYFLIVWDLVDYAKTHDIPVGPGRGSAAGSIVSYALGITDVDPLPFNLFFERFLNPSRISMPDIDIDFCVIKRGQVIDYIKQKYGTSRVAQIITYSYMKARAVIKDVARVLDIDFNESNRISGLIPAVPGMTLLKAFNEIPELREYRERQNIFKTLFKNAFKLENVIRHVGIHAAGVVISPKPLVEHLPIYKDKKTDSLVSQFDGPRLEQVGLLKMDILGLKNLTTMRECKALVKSNRGLDLVFEDIPFDDAKTYKLLQDGKSLGVFQLDSEGMQKLLKNLKPAVLEEVIALIALYRPGPLNMGMHTKFVERKFGREKVDYQFPEIEPILKDTYGIIIYQEQVMMISRVIGGFSMAEADNLRKAMGKKIPELIDKMRSKFMKGAKEKGFNTGKAEKLYNNMAEFGEYGFNKSHSTAYAFISYRTAYLKSNFTLEYMAALLTGEIGDNKREKLANYIRETRKMGIQILPPDVNFSDMKFSVEKDKIRYGFASIKGVGEAASKGIMRARDSVGFFKNLTDFCENVDLHSVNRRTIETLVSCGAFGSTGNKRSVLLAEIDKTIDKAASLQIDKKSGQGNFFDLFDAVEEKASINMTSNLSEWPAEKIYDMERELLGTYITGHPLDKYKSTITAIGAVSSKNIDSMGSRQSIKLAGLIRKFVVKYTDNGMAMALVTLEDMDGSIEIRFFQKDFEQNQTLLMERNIVAIDAETGKQFGNLISLNGKKVVLLEDVQKRSLHIDLSSDVLSDDVLFHIREELIDSSHRGDSPVFFHLVSKNEPVIIKASGGLSINPSEKLINFLKKCPAVEKVWLD